MSLPATIRPEAESDVAEAYAWYEARRPGLGVEFIRAFEVRLSLVEQNPLACPVVHQPVRRALLRRFPFALFYVVEEERLVVIACLHAKRDPDYLRRRVLGG